MQQTILPMKFNTLAVQQSNAAKPFKFFKAFLFASPFFFASCQKIHDHLPGNKTDGEVVYVETNDFSNNNNALLAYVNTGDGNLTPLPGSPFLTNGEGVGNLEQKLGPEDSDTQLKLTSDGKFMLAINPGTNTIAVFAVGIDGLLTPVAGSPFPSGGETPSSIDIKGKYVYVVNKSDDYAHPITIAPNYTTFTIDNNGKLTPVTGSTVETTPGSSPTQALVSYDGKFLFGADWLSFMLMPPVGTLRSFTINNGLLTPVAGTPYFLPDMAGGALGLWQHPKANVLYVGFAAVDKIGVYNINPASGALTYQTAVDAGLAICWIRVNKKGDRMYVLNTGENSVGVYNTSNPQSPVFLSKLTLKYSGPTYTIPDGPTLTTSEVFSLNFAPNEKYLYVVSQYTNTDFTLGNYNYLHALAVDGDGMLSEASEPVALPVPSTLRPQGLAVKEVKLNKIDPNIKN